jgi:hypothetical protein
MDNINRIAIALVLVLCCLVSVPAQEQEEESGGLYFLPMASYEWIKLDDQQLYSPSIGFGIMKGEQDVPFTKVQKRFFAVAMYHPLFLKDEAAPGYPEAYHQIAFMFDGRNERHQFLAIFSAASDKPLAGDLAAIQAGAGWGYELIRRSHVSLILGVLLGVSDFGLDLPNGKPWPLLPLPLVRFGLDTRFLDLAFDFIAAPNLSFTLAPESRIRFTADMSMNNYRSIEDLLCEYTLWYRFFSPEHKLGDFAGLGIGFKNEASDFAVSGSRDKSLELQNTSIFAVLDFTILKLSGGYILDSRLLVDGIKTEKHSRGFFLSVQALYRF